MCGTAVAGAAVDGATASRERVKLGRYIYGPLSPGQTSSSAAPACAPPAGGHSLPLLRPLLARVAHHYGERGVVPFTPTPPPLPSDAGSGIGSRSTVAALVLGPTAAVQLDCLRKLWDSLRAGTTRYMKHLYYVFSVLCSLFYLRNSLCVPHGHAPYMRLLCLSIPFFYTSCPVSQRRGWCYFWARHTTCGSGSKAGTPWLWLWPCRPRRHRHSHALPRPRPRRRRQRRGSRARDRAMCATRPIPLRSHTSILPPLSLPVPVPVQRQRAVHKPS